MRIVHLPPRRRRYDDLLATGEEIRRRFEELIDAREVEPPLDGLPVPTAVPTVGPTLT